MLTNSRLFSLLKQMNDCSDTVSSNVQNQELLKALHNLKCKQCKHCNDDMESLATTIRNTLLEINEIQEKNRERRHQEILVLFENYLRKNEHQVPGTSAYVETEVDRLQHYNQQQGKTTNETLSDVIDGNTIVDEETTIMGLTIPQEAKDELSTVHKEVALRQQSLEIQGLAPYLKSTEPISILKADAETDGNGLPTSKDRRRKSVEGNYESYPITKRSCNTIHRTINEVSSGSKIKDCTEPADASNTWSEEGLVKGQQGIEDSGMTTGLISIGSQKWSNLDDQNRGRTEITQDELMAMRNEMFAKQRKKMEDRERKYACK